MQFKINDADYDVDDVRKEDGLLEYLREDLNLTGTKNGCHVGACGACVVLIDNKPMRACMRKLKHIEAKHITTIEGLEHDDKLHPIQSAFVDKGAVQCGYCIPGMILSGHALLLQNATPSREAIRKAIQNNLCRCTGYVQIVDAIEHAGNAYK